MMKHYTLKWSIDSKGDCLADALDAVSGKNGMIDIEMLNNCLASSERIDKGLYRLTLVTTLESHSPARAVASLIMQDALKRVTDIEPLTFLVKESGSTKWQRVQLEEGSHEFESNQAS